MQLAVLDVYVEYVCHAVHTLTCLTHVTVTLCWLLLLLYYFTNSDSLIEHCIEWARAQFEDSFVAPFAEAKKLCADQVSCALNYTINRVKHDMYCSHHMCCMSLSVMLYVHCSVRRLAPVTPAAATAAAAADTPTCTTMLLEPLC
jgi:Ubiquitin-activating enzyme active site